MCTCISRFPRHAFQRRRGNNFAQISLKITSLFNIIQWPRAIFLGKEKEYVTMPRPPADIKWYCSFTDLLHYGFAAWQKEFPVSGKSNFSKPIYMLDFPLALTSRALHRCHWWYRHPTSFLTGSRTADFHLLSLDRLTELWGAWSFAAEAEAGWNTWHSSDENRMNLKVLIWLHTQEGSFGFSSALKNSFSQGLLKVLLKSTIKLAHHIQI